ncbi:Bgt-2705 [Blumeria graminis f. sp. tritici]|uniref:Dynactin subunit 5 n=3 Tax=Blumeria graminis TaxID=34373 RepID=A0A9X9LB88_BLUGR|nr:dynactin [Blumeria graminis f. sp. tritici 96224]VCU41182.1 Bgt-2705 [Blumeria graminis f. sp. tritici]
MSKRAIKGEYVETDTGNKVSRRSQISGTTNIILGGKTVIQAEVIIRGDLVRTYATSSGSAEKGSANQVAVSIGRYCFFARACELRPPGKLYKGQRIADHVYVGPGSVVEAALIGSHVNIGAHCIIGKFAILKDYVRVLEGSVIPTNMVVPSFSIVAGRPALVVGEIMEGEMEGMELRDLYRSRCGGEARKLGVIMGDIHWST